MSQTTAWLNPVFTDSVKAFKSIERNTLIYIDKFGKLPAEIMDSAIFTPLLNYTNRNKIPISDNSHMIYLRIRIQNNGKEKGTYYYYPGKLYNKIKLFSINNNQISKELPTAYLHDGFIQLMIETNQTKDYLIQLKFFKVEINQIESKLIAEAHFELYKNEMFGRLDDKKIIGFLLSGMLFMMLLVTLLNYFITKKIEFLYNSLYSLCMFLLIFFTTYYTMNPCWFKGFFISFLDLFLLIIGTLFYLAFTRHFLNTMELNPKLDNFLKIESKVIIGLLILYSILYLGFEKYLLEIYLENLIKIILLLAGLLYIFLAIVEKNTLMNYLAMGVALQIFFFVISLGLIFANSSGNKIYNAPIFYFGLGIICSIISFLLGLFYKNRQELITRVKEQEAMKLEVEKQSFENQLTIYKTQQEERNRISADMHDDLGAGMTSIRLYSELAKAKLGDIVLPEIEKISSSANELINNMNAIIWSMSSQNDSMGNMVSYIRSYTKEYLEDTGIKAIINLPDKLPALVINGTIRRNVFLVIKEALQNIVKHSEATEVRVTMHKEPEGFSLIIQDNGKGIQFENLRPFSNGLKNMKKRMQDVDIEFSIENYNGTLIKLYKKTR